MSQERLVVCHNTDGKPCARVTEAESVRLAAAGKGRVIRSRKGQIVRLLLSESAPARVPIGWRGGSQVQTQRIRNTRGELVSPDFHLEFKPLLYAGAER